MFTRSIALIGGRQMALLGSALLTALVVLSACGRTRPAGPPPAPPEVSVVTVERATVPFTIELPGRTTAYRIAQVRARVDGIVLKREFIEGSDVKAGQRLYQVDPAPYRATLDSAQAMLQKAQANVVALNAQAGRYKALLADNGVSKQDYDNAVSAQGQAIADVASGNAAVQTAKINLGYTSVAAPIGGRVGLSQVTEGAYVQSSAATPLTTIQQIDPIYVDLNQSSVQGLRLRRDIATGKVKINGPNQAKVTVILEDGTEYPTLGTLQFTDITVDPSTGSVTVRAVIPNPNHVLLPGMFVRARVDAGVNENALLVPQAGVTHNPQGQATALVVGPDNKVAVRTIGAARTFGPNWVVDEGLSEGDKVIVSGVQKVQPGMLVRAVQATTTAVAADTSAPQLSSPQPSRSSQPVQSAPKASSMAQAATGAPAAR